jgi:hypothetical protein
LKASADSCQVEKIHFGFYSDLETRGAPHMDNIYDAIEEIFADAKGKANGGGDTLRMNGIYVDTKLKFETLKWVIITKNVEPR